MAITNSCGQTIIQYNTQTGDAGNNLFNVSPGTAGQVLTSNGPSAQPTYQTAGIPVTTPVFVQDDFVGAAPPHLGTFISSLGWIGPSSSECWRLLSSTSYESGHPGCISAKPATIFTNYYCSSLGLYAPGSGTITVTFVFKINTLSTGTNQYFFAFGLGDPLRSGDPDNGLIFYYVNNQNSGKWIIKSSKAASVTSVNTTTTVTTGWHNAQIVINSAGTSAEFFMDGASQGTIATNIPVVGIGAGMNIYVNAGFFSSDVIVFDYFSLGIALTNTR